jgi:hypothetical protein
MDWSHRSQFPVIGVSRTRPAHRFLAGSLSMLAQSFISARVTVGAEEEEEVVAMKEEPEDLYEDEAPAIGEIANTDDE